MAHDLNHLNLLQAALRHTFECDVAHQETIPVHETVKGKTIWQGNVEVFKLCGHPEAKKCFAWLHHEDGKSPRFMAVLEKKYVTSAEQAVKSAFLFKVQTELRPNTPT